VTEENAERVRISWDEYEALGPDVGEYVDGYVVNPGRRSGRHQDICANLWRVLQTSCPPGVRARMGWGWKPGQDEYRPDVMVFDETEQDELYTAMPHLAVEVLSSDRAADLMRKFAKYSTMCLPRFWVIDPEVPELLVFELTGRAYVRRARLGPDDRAVLDFGPGRATIGPRDLLA
jgi:Uma2 family endonuclease